MAERKLVVVRSPFFTGNRMVGVGEVWGADDPVVRNYPNAFRPLDVKSSVEAASAAPKRRTAVRRATRSKPKATTKK